MGRELRRVPLDFKWELNKIWKGFVNPYPSEMYKYSCEMCGGTGYNPATKELLDTWYDTEGYYKQRWWYDYDANGRACAIIEAYPGACKRWLHKLTQEEVDVLIANLRFAHHTSAEEVNTANRPGAYGFGHDSINQHLCVKARAERLGVYGTCEKCAGKGEIVFNTEVEKLHREWEQEDPPSGEGWQVWETVSEGSPVTPVFDSPEKLIDYLATVGIFEKVYNREAATKFVMEKNWVPGSLYIPGTGWFHNIEAAPYLGKNNESESNNSNLETSST